MNWSRAKSILILFLIFTSLLLSGMLHISNQKSSMIEPQTISYTTQLLEKKGVYISPELLPNKLYSLSVYEGENVISDYFEFAKTVFPDAEKISDTNYNSSMGTIEFFGDKFDIKFSDGLPTDKKLKSPSEKAKNYLSTIGINISDAVINTTNNAEGLFTVCFTNKLNGYSLFDNKISVTLSGENIVAVSGVWFGKKSVQSSNFTLDSAPGLLLKYTEQNPEFRNIEITAIEIGYAINEQGVFHKESSILPVYKIVTSDGNEFYIDARHK